MTREGPLNRPLIPRQARPRRAPFALLPLIDVMFLLLIFFMLSSQIAPYSLMPVGQVSAAVDDRGPARAPAAAGDLAIRVSAGAVGIGGQSIAIAEVGPVLKGLVSQGVTGFLVVSTRSATVQDIVSTLEALQAAEARDVRLVSAAGGGP